MVLGIEGRIVMIYKYKCPSCGRVKDYPKRGAHPVCDMCNKSGEEMVQMVRVTKAELAKKP